MSDETLEQAVREMKHAAQDLAAASVLLSQRVLTAASEATKDPKGAAHKAARSAAHQLDAAAKEIERILGHL